MEEKGFTTGIRCYVCRISICGTQPNRSRSLHDLSYANKFRMITVHGPTRRRLLLAALQIESTGCGGSFLTDKENIHEIISGRTKLRRTDRGL